MLKKIINKIKITFWLIKIGDGFLNKANLLKWLYMPNKYENITIKFKAFGKIGTLTVPNNRDQLMTLKGVFLNNDWDILENSEPEIIFDLGAYTGISTMYFLLKYQKAIIYAFEPNIDSYNYLIENFTKNPRVILKNIAVAEKDGFINLYTPNNRNLSSSIMHRSGSDKSERVVSETFDNICNNIKKIDLLKFNIEGGEINIFNSKSFYSKVIFFIGEVHGDLIPKEFTLKILKDRISNFFFIKEKYMTKIGRGIWFGKIKNNL